MAIFKSPRITSLQRATLVLEASEIVFDTDLGTFYGGDGLTLGGFPIGQGAGGGGQTFNFTLTQTDIDNASIELDPEPSVAEYVRLTVVGGIEQVNGVDFEVTGSTLSWSGLGLDNFLEVNDILIITY